MKLAIAFFISILICSNAVAKNPNYILVFIDDMGWGDFSCFGNEHAKTPNTVSYTHLTLPTSDLV